MSNWIPEGSVPYDTAYCDGSYSTESDDGSVPYFSTVPYKGPKVRDARMCKANDNTCKAWASSGSKLCVGHRKAETMAQEAAKAIADAEQALRDEAENKALHDLGFV